MTTFRGYFLAASGTLVLLMVVLAGLAGNLSVHAATASLTSKNAWTLTGSMIKKLQGQTAVLLTNGKVLVIGGQGNQRLASTELYDPATGT